MRAAAAGSQRAAGVNENPDSSRDEEARRRATAGKAASPGPPRRAARVRDVYARGSGLQVHCAAACCGRWEDRIVHGRHVKRIRSPSCASRLV